MHYLILHKSVVVRVVAVFVLIATTYFIYRKLYRKFVLDEKELLANGLGFEEEKSIKDEKGFITKKITVHKVDGYWDKKNKVYCLTHFNREINNKNISLKDPVIEKITKEKVIDSKVIKTWRGYRAVFYLENFKEQYGLEVLSGKKLLAGQYLVGIDPRGDLIFNSTIEEMNWITAVIGGQGSGKTTTIISQIFTYYKSFIDSGLDLPILIIVDIKKTDYLPLIEYFRGRTEVVFFNPLDLDDLCELNRRIECLIADNTAFFKKLANDYISVSHWHYLDDELKKKKLKSHCFIFDEIPAYLSLVENKIKLSKEPNELEQRAFADQEQRKRLSLLLARMFNTLRPTGTTIWLASQTGAVSDLAIPFNNLRSHFLMSKTTGATAQVWGLPHELATRNDLRRGLFIYSNSAYTGLIKTLFINIKGLKNEK